MAPVVSIKNSRAQILRDYFENDEGNVEWVASFGPEILTKAPNDNFITSFFVNSQIGETTFETVLNSVSDANPKTISPIGHQNQLSFYPAGTSI